MKRDMDLIRELMLKLEALPKEAGRIVHVTPDAAGVHIDGYGKEEIDYHLSLVEKAHFVDMGASRPWADIGFRGLTWAGHDFLDSVRSPDVWDRTKQTAADRMLFFALALLCRKR